MENRLETTDSPTSSSEAKKSYLRVKKSKALASNGLIPQEGKQIADNDQTETDYTGSRITTDPPAKSKEGLTQQYNTDSDREGTRLDGRLQGRDKIRSSTN